MKCSPQASVLEVSFSPGTTVWGMFWKLKWDLDERNRSWWGSLELCFTCPLPVSASPSLYLLPTMIKTEVPPRLPVLCSQVRE